MTEESLKMSNYIGYSLNAANFHHSFILRYQALFNAAICAKPTNILELIYEFYLLLIKLEEMERIGVVLHSRL